MKTSAMLFRRSAIKTIVATGLLAGTLDAFAAVVVYQADPLQLFQFIASGAFGKNAFTEGLKMVFWGVVFHYFIACFWTLLFFAAYAKVALLFRKAWIAGLIYGILIWLCMNLIVLPLSKIPQNPLSASGVITGMLILMAMVGLPIAWSARRYFAAVQ